MSWESWREKNWSMTWIPSVLKLQIAHDWAFRLSDDKKPNRKQCAALEQSSLRNDAFLEADSYWSSECLKSTRRLLKLNRTCTYLVSTVTDVDGDPPGKSVTVDTKHAHVRFKHNKRSVIFRHPELKKESASKKGSFLKKLCSKAANCSRTLHRTGLSVTNFLVSAAVARRSVHKLSQG